MPAPYHTPKGDRLAAAIDAELADELVGYLVDAETGAISPAYTLGDHSPEEVHADLESARRTAAWVKATA
jgi:hypothetical protein